MIREASDVGGACTSVLTDESFAIVREWMVRVRRDVIVIGASAGGVEALRTVVAGFPPGLDATVLVVLHVPSYGGSVLPAILTRSGPLPARHPESGESLPRGEVLVAPPDHHIVVDSGRVLLTRGPKENGHRPAIDVLFRSAARSLGARVVGVVLSGVLDDGTAGLSAVVGQGGLAVVQDPEDAMYSAMPRNALHAVRVENVLPAAEIGGLLAGLTTQDIPARQPSATALLEMEAELAMMDDEAMSAPDRPGIPSGFSCPDCHGVLYEIRDGAMVRFRCRVGHAWSAESLYGEQSQQLDSALWMALRGLEEKAALARSMGERASAKGHTLTAQRFTEHAEEAQRAAALIRDMLEGHTDFRNGADPGLTG